MSTVSIIIPTFNRKEMVCNAIDSALDQTFKEREILVIDDGSNDHTEEFLNQKYNDRIRFIRQENRGVAHARNKGINEAHGKYLAFLDSDDIWMPFKLEAQMEIFNSNPEIGLGYCGYTMFDQNGELIKNVIPVYKGMIYNKLIFNNYIGGASLVIIKRECVEKVGFFRSKYSPTEDWDLWIRISKEYQVDFARDTLVKYAVHQGGISQDEKQLGRAIKIILHDHLEQSNFNKEVQVKKQRVLLNHYSLWADKYLKQKQLCEFKRCFVEYLHYANDKIFFFDNTNLKMKEELIVKSIDEYVKSRCQKQMMRKIKRDLYQKYYKAFAYKYYYNEEMVEFRRCLLQVIKYDYIRHCPRHFITYIKSFLGRDIAESIHMKRKELYTQAKQIITKR